MVDKCSGVEKYSCKNRLCLCVQHFSEFTFHQRTSMHNNYVYELVGPVIPIKPHPKFVFSEYFFGLCSLRL